MHYKCCWCETDFIAAALKSENDNITCPVCGMDSNPEFQAKDDEVINQTITSNMKNKSLKKTS